MKNTIATHIPFLISTIQPILNSTYGSDTLSKDLFIHALLEDVTRKVRNSIPKLLRKTSWLSHTIHELLEFDKSLREDFAYFPGDHNGMANILLDNQECYESWFSAEKRCKPSHREARKLEMWTSLVLTLAFRRARQVRRNLSRWTGF